VIEADRHQAINPPPARPIPIGFKNSEAMAPEQVEATAAEKMKKNLLSGQQQKGQVQNGA
jgi:hypothetical protein